MNARYAAAKPQEEHRVALRHRVARDQHFAGRDGAGPTLVLVRGAPLLLHEAQILRVRVGDRRNEALGVLRVPAVEERVRDPHCEIEICRVGGGKPEPMSSRFVATPERVERDRRGFDGMDARGVDRQNVLLPSTGRRWLACLAGASPRGDTCGQSPLEGTPRCPGERTRARVRRSPREVHFRIGARTGAVVVRQRSTGRRALTQNRAWPPRLWAAADGGAHRGAVRAPR